MSNSVAATPPGGAGRADQRSVKAVALGGGHGLHACLSALRLVTTEVTAVVTVADDGGSSGRIRHELDVLPPGDLRMALSALAGDEPRHRAWADVLQHRLGGSGVLAGHPVGNLLMTGLLDNPGADPVQALAIMAELVGAVGRVLPMSPVPLHLIGEADRFDPADPERRRRIRGQSSLAATPGRVRSVQLLPAGAPACASAVDAVREADLVVLGPGSWFTSVIPHLLLRELGTALTTTRARVVVTMNLVPQPGETDGYTSADLLRILCEHAAPSGGLPVFAVIADAEAAADDKELVDFAHAMGAHLLLSKLATEDNDAVHDPLRLAEAYREALDLASAVPNERAPAHTSAPPRTHEPTGGQVWR